MEISKSKLRFPNANKGGTLGQNHDAIRCLTIGCEMHMDCVSAVDTVILKEFDSEMLLLLLLS